MIWYLKKMGVFWGRIVRSTLARGSEEILSFSQRGATDTNNQHKVYFIQAIIWLILTLEKSV